MMSFKSSFYFATRVGLRGTVFSQSPRLTPRLPILLSIIQWARIPTTPIRRLSLWNRVHTLAEHMAKVAPVLRHPTLMEKMLSQGGRVYPIPNLVPYPICTLPPLAQLDCSQVYTAEPEIVDCADLYRGLEEFEQSSEDHSSESPDTFSLNCQPTPLPEPLSYPSSELDQELPGPTGEDVPGERDELQAGEFDDWNNDPEIAALFADAGIKLQVISLFTSILHIYLHWWI